MKSMFRHKASGVCPLLWHHSFLQLRVASAAVTLPPGSHDDDSNDDTDDDDNNYDDNNADNKDDDVGTLPLDLLQPEPGRG